MSPRFIPLPQLITAHRRRHVGTAVAIVTLLIASSASIGIQMTSSASGASVSLNKSRTTHKSWNRHVNCRATVTTLRHVLGTKTNKLGGATYRGGEFKPGIPDRRSFNPPCRRRHTPTLVQLNRVKVGSCTQINEDGDWTCNLTDPSVPRRRSIHMSSIHIETDKKFRKRTNWTKPPGGRLINVQGFVFWDPDHTTAEWHHFSGWELHSFTAWRRSVKR